MVYHNKQKLANHALQTNQATTYLVPIIRVPIAIAIVVPIIAAMMARMSLLRISTLLLGASLSATGEEHDDRAEEEQDHRGQTSPHAVAVESAASAAI